MRSRVSAALALLSTVLVFGASAQAQQPPAGGRGPALVPLTIESSAFPDGGVVPGKYSMAGGNTQPGFKITNAPANVQTYAVIFHDLDVAIGGNPDDVLHWVVWNIPGTSTGLPEGVMPVAELPDGTRQVSLRAAGYMGPGAPATGPYHHYTFELYALDTKIDVPPGTPQEAANTRAAVMKAVDGHALGKAVIVGRFHQ